MAATPAITASGITNTTVNLSWSYSGALATEVFVSASVTGPGGVSSTAASGTATASGLSAGTSYTWTYVLTLYDTRFGPDDSFTRTATATATTTVPLPVWSGSYSSGTVRSSYSSTVSASPSGVSTSYSLVSGSLPAGLSLSTVSNAARISGTPTTKNTYSFTLRATNSAGSTDASFSINIVNPTGEVSYYTGSSWVQKPMTVYNGTSWPASTQVYYYNGTSWVLTRAN